MSDAAKAMKTTPGGAPVTSTAAINSSAIAAPSSAPHSDFAIANGTRDNTENAAMS